MSFALPPLKTAKSAGIRARAPGAWSAQRILSAVAWGLLSIQCALIWAGGRFITQDGSAHLYNGVVAWNLLAHPDSAYSAAYRFIGGPIPNWTITSVIALLTPIAGIRHTEQVVVTLLLIASFLAFHYAAGALGGGQKYWSPLANFVFQNCFLWLGFFNFYLGIALFLFTLGFYLRRAGALTSRGALILSSLLLALFWTHLFAVELALMTIGLVALLVVRGRPRRDQARHIGALLAAAAPVIFLTLWFSRSSSSSASFEGNLAQWAMVFPSHAFWIANGIVGRQGLTCLLVLSDILVALVFRERKLRNPIVTGILLAAALNVLLYLLAPNTALGGTDVKVRFAWAAILLGVLGAHAIPRPRAAALAIGVLVSALVLAALMNAWRINTVAVPLVDSYAAAFQGLPRGSRFVRLRYGAPTLQPKYGLPRDLPWFPTLHADAYAAAQYGLIDLSDYEAQTNLFPITLRDEITAHQRGLLWGLEIATDRTPEALQELRRTLPEPLDYVAIYASGSARAGAEARQLESSGARLVSTAGNPVFLRIYHLPESRR